MPIIAPIALPRRELNEKTLALHTKEGIYPPIKPPINMPK